MSTKTAIPAPDKPLIDKARHDDIIIASGKPVEDGPAEEINAPNDTAKDAARHAADDDGAKARNAPRNDRNLREGLEASMDASDPPSTLQP